MAIIWLRWRLIFFREFVATEEAGHVFDLDRGVTSRTDFLVPAGQHGADRRRDLRGDGGRRGRLRGRRRGRGFLVLPGATVSENDEDYEADGDKDRGEKGEWGLSGQGDRRHNGRVAAVPVDDFNA